MSRIASSIAVAAGLLLQAAGADAFPGVEGTLAAKYPAATNLHTCGTCHVSFVPGNPGLNAYGADILSMIFEFDFATAITDVESNDSDGDGTLNVEEINAGAGFFPGWTCMSYTSAEDAPSDLVDFVDPVDPGCDGATTTATTSTTITTTTSVTVTSTSTTTTTLSGGEGSCGDPVAPFDGPLATDCLFILQSAVGSEECAECLCDTIGSNGVNSTDALLCLRVAVGASLPLECPVCSGRGGTTRITAGEPTTATDAFSGRAEPRAAGNRVSNFRGNCS